MSFNAKTYWEERLKENYGLHGVGFIGHGVAYNIAMYKVRKKLFFRFLKPYLKRRPQPVVLDVGSGTGFYIDCWKEIGAKQIDGSDLTSVAVSNLKQKFPENQFYELDISGDISGFIPGKYDFISAFDILFHIVDDALFEKAIANINTLLKKDGYFILTDNFIHEPTYRSIHHVSRNIAYFEKVLRDNGFEIEMRRATFYFMNTPVDGKRKFLKWFWKMQSKVIYRGEKWARFMAAVIYPFELLMLRFVKEGPSTEFMVCRKVK